MYQGSAVTYAKYGRQPAWGSTLRTPGAGAQPVEILDYENTDDSLHVGLFASCEAGLTSHKHLTRHSGTEDS